MSNTLTRESAVQQKKILKNLIIEIADGMKNKRMIEQRDDICQKTKQQ